MASTPALRTVEHQFNLSPINALDETPIRRRPGVGVSSTIEEFSLTDLTPGVRTGGVTRLGNEGFQFNNEDDRSVIQMNEELEDILNQLEALIPTQQHVKSHRGKILHLLLYKKDVGLAA